MDKKTRKRLREYKVMLMADAFVKGKEWRGYTVYMPVYKKEKDVGLPRVVLERNGVFRESSYQECFEYMTFIGKKAV